MFRPLTVLAVIALMLVPVAMAQTPSEPAPEEDPWWLDTLLDKNRNGIQDDLEVALEMGEEWITEGRISVLVDFDHTPTENDEALLEQAVDFEVEFRFHLQPIISGWVPVERISDLLEVEGVVLVSLNNRVHALLDTAHEVHGVDMVWEQYGYRGEGVVIAVIDTGIDPLHESLDDQDDDVNTTDPKMVAFYDAIGAPEDQNGTTVAYDDHGHGSHCAGITSGTGGNESLYRGMAPQSSLVGVKVLDGGGSGSFSQVMMGMQWTVDNKDKFNIRVASMSLGGFGLIELTQSEEESVSRMADDMVDAGIVLAIAAGNSGPSYGTIGTPGISDKAITVGATDHSRNIAVYSSRGPTQDGLIKPDLTAIGSNVISVDANTGNGYTAKSGTSMATPMVAGMAALMVQANPDITPDEVKDQMRQTAEYRWEKPYDIPLEKNNDYGWGFVEGGDAVTLAGGIVDVQVLPALLTPTVEAGSHLEFIVTAPVNHLEIRDAADPNATWVMVNGTDTGADTLVIPVPGQPGPWHFLVRGVTDAGNSPIIEIMVNVTAPTIVDEEFPLMMVLLASGFGLVLLVGGVWATMALRKGGKPAAPRGEILVEHGVDKVLEPEVVADFAEE